MLLFVGVVAKAEKLMNSDVVVEIPVLVCRFFFLCLSFVLILSF